MLPNLRKILFTTTKQRYVVLRCLHHGLYMMHIWQFLQKKDVYGHIPEIFIIFC